MVRPPLPVAVPLRETFLYLYIKKKPGEKKEFRAWGELPSLVKVF